MRIRIPYRPARTIRQAFSVPRHPLPNRQLTTLAIETSCDDTCVAVLSAPDSPSSSSPTTLLYNKKITSDNSAYAGIHPKIAILSHTTTLSGLVEQAIHSSLPHPPDFISVTRGPGMPTNLSVGLCTAKGLALAWRVPLVGVHHMQAHALTPRLVHALSPETENGVDFPFLTVLVSGGHTLLVHSKTLTEHEVLASTESLPLGNMLDQVARWILPGDVLAAERSVGYGALLERFAFGDGDGDGDGEKYAWYAPPRTRFDEIQPYDSSSSSSREEGRGGTWKLTPPLADRRAMAYSFTGLNSQVQRIVSSFPDSEGISTDERRHLARATMQVAFEHLASRVIFALEALSRRQDVPRIKTLVLSGGVASNSFLRHVFRSILDVRGYEDVRITAPPPSLCTDNAAMIAWAGVEMFRAGWRTGLDVAVKKKWSLDGRDDEDGGVLGREGTGDGLNYIRREGFAST